MDVAGARQAFRDVLALEQYGVWPGSQMDEEARHELFTARQKLSWFQDAQLHYEMRTAGRDTALTADLAGRRHLAREALYRMWLHQDDVHPHELYADAQDALNTLPENERSALAQEIFGRDDLPRIDEEPTEPDKEYVTSELQRLQRIQAQDAAHHAALERRRGQLREHEDRVFPEQAQSRARMAGELNARIEDASPQPAALAQHPAPPRRTSLPPDLAASAAAETRERHHRRQWAEVESEASESVVLPSADLKAVEEKVRTAERDGMDVIDSTDAIEAMRRMQAGEDPDHVVATTPSYRLPPETFTAGEQPHAVDREEPKDAGGVEGRDPFDRPAWLATDVDQGPD